MEPGQDFLAKMHRVLDLYDQLPADVEQVGRRDRRARRTQHADVKGEQPHRPKIPAGAASIAMASAAAGAATSVQPAPSSRSR